MPTLIKASKRWTGEIIRAIRFLKSKNGEAPTEEMIAHQIGRGSKEVRSTISKMVREGTLSTRFVGPHEQIDLS